MNIAPWAKEFADIKSEAMALNWSSKHPFAYWKGNPDVSSPVRIELLQCNDSQAWGAQILRQVIYAIISYCLRQGPLPDCL